MFIDQRFMSKLDGITDPEEKRKLIGAEFIRVFEEESKRLGPFDLLPAALRHVGSDIRPTRLSGNRSGLRQPLSPWPAERPFGAKPLQHKRLPLPVKTQSDTRS